jgi:hypothetical protein
MDFELHATFSLLKQLDCGYQLYYLIVFLNDFTLSNAQFFLHLLKIL